KLTGQLPSVSEVLTPTEYFRQMFTPECLRHIVEQSNLYSVQKDVNSPLNCSEKELEQFIGVAFHMSIYGIPATRMCWQAGTRIDKIADVMPMRRWEQIKANIHFNDNSLDLSPTNPCRDPLFKLRPLLNFALDTMNNIPMDEHLSVDEQIIPYKGKSRLKLYNPSKPHKWGYKVYLLCDSKGIAYNFEFHTGKIQPLIGMPDLGASSNIVLRVASIVPQGQNFKLYHDNWFTSTGLEMEMAKKKIYCLGTVRANRLKGCSLKSDKDLKTIGRGAFDEKVATFEGGQLIACKWQDNRTVTMLSTFAGAYPTCKVKRWDRKLSKVTDVQCPSSVVTYNKNMGGIRSRKWYLRIFFHLMDMLCVNAWLLYRRDYHACVQKGKEELGLREFKSSVAEVLCKQGSSSQLKRGRPSSESSDMRRQKKRETKPQQEVRKDGMAHWPYYSDKQGRCKKHGCTGQTRVMCEKCGVHLCFTPKKNCLRYFHT
uniref:PiggyBac transposable element-derived protein domain-containing protein n=1 Tax=Astyanax mexicanus TaxID=7994 RepID=A0A3B1KH96_ASTMX